MILLEKLQGTVREMGGGGWLCFPNYTIKCEESMCLGMSVTSTFLVNFFPQQKKKKKKKERKKMKGTCVLQRF